MFWLSRALLHTVIYFSFAGSCFTSVSQWCYGSSLFFVCPDWLGSKVSNYFSTFKPQVWFPQTGLVRDVPLKHKTFIGAWKMLSNKQGLVKSGPCVRKLLTGLIMYIYPLKIKNIVLYCIVSHWASMFLFWVVWQASNVCQGTLYYVSEKGGC